MREVVGVVWWVIEVLEDTMIPGVQSTEKLSSVNGEKNNTRL